MLNIKYDDWKACCNGIFKLNNNHKYIQMYPFKKLGDKEKQKVISEEFFNKYIKSGFFMEYEEFSMVCNNYIVKENGDFRNSTLVSPIMYLLLSVIVKSISKIYKSNRPNDIDIFYAGDFETNDFSYKKQYDKFYTLINCYKKEFEYLIKIDISKFYDFIDLNILFKIIEEEINRECINIQLRDLYIYKELLLYIGNGKFPLLQNSTACSYLSTVVYLDKFDALLYEFLNNNIDIEKFRMIRYVDDLYILLDLNDISKVNKINDKIIHFISSELKKIGLSLNHEKVKLQPTNDIKNNIGISIYNECTDIYSICINYFDEDKIETFFIKLEEIFNNNGLNINIYKELIKNTFEIDSIDYSYSEVFNMLIYSKKNIFNKDSIVERLETIIKDDYSIIKLDIRRFMQIILNSKCGRLIKHILNSIFHRFRSKTNDLFDIYIAINYLLERNFKHNDLVNIIKEFDNDLYIYITWFCKNDFIDVIEKEEYIPLEYFYDYIYYKKDNKLFYLYWLYIFEKSKYNIYTSFAYYKNYFDRITAHFGLLAGNKGKKGRPNYKNYYKEALICKEYEDVENSNSTISNAHRLRNNNPVSHSQGDLIDDNLTNTKLNNMINKLQTIIYTHINNKITNENKYVALTKEE